MRVGILVTKKVKAVGFLEEGQTRYSQKTALLHSKNFPGI